MLKKFINRLISSLKTIKPKREKPLAQNSENFRLTTPPQQTELPLTRTNIPPCTEKKSKNSQYIQRELSLETDNEAAEKAQKDRKRYQSEMNL
jgi:hypothetical protein